MGKHKAIDSLVTSMGAIYGDAHKFFSSGIQSPALADLVRDMRCSTPEICGPGEHTVTLETTAKGEIEARFDVLQWVGDTAPSLIFHHGSGDTPYQRRLEKILSACSPKKGSFDNVNIIATCSPYNRSRREYLETVRSLRHFGTLLAGSAVLIEGIRRALPLSSRFVVSGISLGGWITNLHHVCFDSADEYRPIFAGAALDALFTNSAYAALVSNKALAQADKLEACLNFETDFSQRGNGKVYPLLARYDQYILFERQSVIYRPDHTTVIDKGHITGSADNSSLLEFLAAAFTVSEEKIVQ